ncbi:unnamed protein product, partial [Didymodactylos carnosus]
MNTLTLNYYQSQSAALKLPLIFALPKINDVHWEYLKIFIFNDITDNGVITNLDSNKQLDRFYVQYRTDHSFWSRDTGFTGDRCQYLSTCTASTTCQNGGTCATAYDNSSGILYYTCVCPSRYSGLFCDIQNQCPPSFYGANCDVECSPVNSCASGHFECNASGGKDCQAN